MMAKRKPPAVKAGPRRDASAADVARALGITKMAVSQMTARGMPHDRPAKKGAPARFNLDEAIAWKARNTVGNGHGGRRSGPDRNKRDTPPDRISAETKSDHRQWSRGPDGIKRALEEGDGDQDETLEDQPQAKLWCILQAEKIRIARIERSILEGTLVKADDARKAFSLASRAAARSLRSMGRAVAGQVIARLGAPMTPENSAAVRDIIDAQSDQVADRLARCEFGPSKPGAQEE